MHNKIDKFMCLFKQISPRDSKVALTSGVVSLVIASITSVVFYFMFLIGDQPYHDIAVGNITLYGIYKDIDFHTYYVFIIVYVLSFFTLCGTLNRKKIQEKANYKLNAFQTVLGLVPLFLIILYRMNTLPKLYICFILFLVLIFLWLSSAKMKQENIVKVLTSIYCIYLSSSGLLAFVNYYFPSIAERGSKYFILLLSLVLLIYCFILYILYNGKIENRGLKFIDPLLAFTQLVIPLNLYGLINTRYFYQGSEYNLVYYDRFKQIVITGIIILLIFTIITMVKSVKAKSRISEVSLSTIVTMVAVSYWNFGHNLVVNPDQFHTGETAVVFQQIIELGQKWNTEFVSVLQGLGLTLSGFNELIFGGTYATYAQAQNLFMVLIALVIAILLYPVVNNKWLLLLVTPIMPLFSMDRTYLIVPIYLLLINPKIIKSPIKWSYCYIATCIIHVWYQPSYGGAVAASLVPVFLLIWYRSFKNNPDFDYKIKSNRIRIGVFFITIVVIGLLCIPLLLSVFHFLKVNGYETVIGNGISVLQTITQPPFAFTGVSIVDYLIQFLYKFGSGLLALIIMLYMFSRYVIKQKDNEKLIQGVILTLSTAIAYVMMLPAMFTRIDPGMSRVGVTGFIFFGFLVMILLYLYRTEIKYKSIALVIFGLSISTGLYLIYPPYLQVHEKVNTVIAIPDNSIYATPENTGLYNLGYAFIPNEQYLNEALVINEMCNLLLNEDQTYYDMTDKSIYYLFTNKKIPGLYASPLVVSNEKIQSEALKVLDSHDIPLVYINQPLGYIGVSQSLRSYRIYRYFMEKDYSFVRYKGCDFLVRNDMDLSKIKDNIEMIDTNVIGKFDDLIDEKLYNSTKLSEATGNNIILVNSIDTRGESLFINGADPFVIFSFNSDINFNDIQLVEINLKNKPNSGMSGQLFVETQNVTHNEFNTIHFDMNTSKILIPLYKYEQFQLDSKLVNLRLDFDTVADGADVAVDSIRLYSLDDVQKSTINQQYIELAGKIKDDRLDAIFHQPNLANLPNQWGLSFDLIKDRFLPSESTLNPQEEKVTINDIPYTVTMNIAPQIGGRQGEFLRFKLKYSDENHSIKSANDHSVNINTNDLYESLRHKLKPNSDIRRNVTVIVKGIDMNGNELYEEFYMKAVNGNILIPIASSPNCIQAQELTNIEITFQPEETPYNVEIEECQFYRLVK